MEAHRVSRTYLKGFAAQDGQSRGVVVYRKSKDVRSQVQAQDVTDVKRVSTATDFYVLQTSAGPSNSIEDILSRIEARWPAMVKALKRGPLDSEDLGMLAAFAATWEARGERTRTMMAKPLGKIFAMGEQLYRAHGVPDDEIPARMRAFIERDIFSGDAVPDPMNLALTVIPGAAKDAFEMYRRMNKLILQSTSADFFTSDHPIVWFDPENCTRNDPCPNRLALTAEVTFPLTRRFCLVMSYLPLIPTALADEECVEVINARTAINALRETYAPPALGETDKKRHETALLEPWLARKSLLERYGDEHGGAADVRAMLDAIGLEWEAFVHANKFVERMAERAGVPVSGETH